MGFLKMLYLSLSLNKKYNQALFSHRGKCIVKLLNLNDSYFQLGFYLLEFFIDTINIYIKLVCTNILRDSVKKLM